MMLPDFPRHMYSRDMNRRLDEADGQVHLYTIHGSRLYGLAHEGSDTDRYLVADINYGRILQEAKGQEDLRVVPLRVFMRQIHNGDPMALEALWSPSALLSPMMQEFARSFRVGSGRAQHGARVYIDMYLGDGRIAEMKNRRHVLRVATQLHQAMEEGRFDPVLRPQAAALLTRIASRYEGEDFWPVVDAWFDWASDTRFPLGQRRVR